MLNFNIELLNESTDCKILLIRKLEFTNIGVKSPIWYGFVMLIIVISTVKESVVVNVLIWIEFNPERVRAQFEDKLELQLIWLAGFILK